MGVVRVCVSVLITGDPRGQRTDPVIGVLPGRDGAAHQRIKREIGGTSGRFIERSPFCRTPGRVLRLRLGNLRAHLVRRARLAVAVDSDIVGLLWRHVAKYDGRVITSRLEHAEGRRDLDRGVAVTAHHRQLAREQRDGHAEGQADVGERAVVRIAVAA